MKRYLLTICLTPFLFAGCNNGPEIIDNTNPAELDGTDKIALAAPGVHVKSMLGMEEPVKVTVTAYKNGGYSTPTGVNFTIDENLLAEYNAENNTSLEMLPSSGGYYTAGEGSFSLGTYQFQASYEFEYDPEMIYALYEGAAGVEKYALPVKVTASGAEVDSGGGYAIYIFKIEQPVISLENKIFDTQIAESGKTSPKTLNFTATMNFVGINDVSIGFEDDQDKLEDAVAEYNSKNGTSYRLLPAAAYSFMQDPKIPGGTDRNTINVNVDGSKVPTGLYLLPIMLDGNDNSFEVGNVHTLYVPLKVYLSRAGWEINTSSQNVDNPRGYAVDGDEGTYWHVMFKNAGVIVDVDRIFQINLKENTKVRQIVLTPNFNPGTATNWVQRYDIYTCAEDKGDGGLKSVTLQQHLASNPLWTSVGAPATWTDWTKCATVSPANTVTPLIITFDEPVDTRYIRIQMFVYTPADNSIGIHEINLLTWDDIEQVEPEEPED